MKREQARELELAPERRAVIVVGPRLERALGHVGVQVGDDDADRHVARDHLPGGPRGEQRLLEPAQLRGAEERGRVVERRLTVRRVRPAIAPLVEHEDLERRTVGERPVDALRIDRVEAERVVVEHGTLGERGQERRAADAVPLVAERLARIPVVARLVVVPLDEHRDLGAEAALVVVQEVVGEVAAELLERLGHLGLGLGGHVAPDRAVVERDLGLDRPVRVDLVAGVDEEVRVRAPHDLVHLHAAPGGVDAPPLPGFVAREREGHGAAGRGRRPESAGHRRAKHLRAREVLEQHAIEDLLSRAAAPSDRRAP